MDNQALTIGKYKNDLLTGICLIWISHETYYIGYFTRGLLDGPFVIRSPLFVVYSQAISNKIES
jgi:hypothetical protein